MRVKVLLADDSEIARRAVRRILTTHPAIDLAGEASTYAQVLQKAKELNPHVIVMDLRVLQACKERYDELRPQLNEGSRLLAISVYLGDDTKAFADKCGAEVLVDKMNLFHELVPTIILLGWPTGSVAVA